MTALEIRVIAYALLCLALLGSAAWVGHKLTAMHYQGVIDANREAQDKAIQRAQQAVIRAQADRDAAIQQAEKDHETLIAADTASRDAVLGSVRSLEAALHLSAVHPAVADPSQPGAAAASSGRVDGLAETVGRLNAAVERAVSACQHDSSALAGILEVAPK